MPILTYNRENNVIIKCPIIDTCIKSNTDYQVLNDVRVMELNAYKTNGDYPGPKISSTSTWTTQIQRGTQTTSV